MTEEKILWMRMWRETLELEHWKQGNRGRIFCTTAEKFSWQTDIGKKIMKKGNGKCFG